MPIPTAVLATPNPTVAPTPTVVPLDWQSVDPPGPFIGPVTGVDGGFIAFSSEHCEFLDCYVTQSHSSRDGRNWTDGTRAGGAFDRASFRGVIGYGDELLAIGTIWPSGDDADVTAALWRSSDGTDWHVIDGSQISAGPPIAVCEGSGYYGTMHNVAAVGDLLLEVGTVLQPKVGPPCRPLRDPNAHTYLRSSADGVTWNDQTVPNPIDNTNDEYWNDSVDTLIGGTQFLIAANDRPAILRSSDGASWKSARLPGASDYIQVRQIVEFDGGYLALGWARNLGDGSSPTTVWSSPDGADWQIAREFPPGDGNAIVSLTSFGRGVLAQGYMQPDPESQAGTGVMVTFDGSGWSYPQTPFDGYYVDYLVSTDRWAIALALNADEFGDQLMWRADLTGIEP